MTNVQAKILELFETLPAEDRQDLLDELSRGVGMSDLADGLTAEDIAAIEEGWAQIERGEGSAAEEVLDRIAARFQFPRA